MVGPNEMTVILLVYILPAIALLAILYAVVRKAAYDGTKRALREIEKARAEEKGDKSKG